MPKYTVTERVARWVTYTYEIEAPDEDAALEELHLCEPVVEIGELLGEFPAELDIEEFE